MIYTVNELANRWQCNRLTVIKLINLGELKAFKLGAIWRITEEEVKRIEGRENHDPHL